MKKIMVAMFALLLFAAPAFAVNNLTDLGTLAIGGGALANGDDSATLNIGLSPKVVGRYVTDGNSEITAQWYALATVHPGGSVGYGTAQDVNNIYMKTFNTGDETTTITDEIQVNKTPAGEVTDSETGEVVTPAQATWTAGGWSTTTPTASTN